VPLTLLFLLILIPVEEKGRILDLPPQMQEQFARGLEAQRAGDLDGAEELFKALLEQGGKSAPVYNALGNIYQMKGQPKKALAAFAVSGRLNPGDPLHHALTGVSLLSLGRSREATGEFKLAVQKQPDNLVFREQLAAAYVRLQDYPAAIDQYLRLLELQAGSAEFRYQLGHAYLAYSLSCFKKIKDINDGSARLLQEMGDQYLVQGKLDKAIENYEKARGADPSIPEVYFLLGQCYLKQGDKDKALEAIDQALALTPGSPAAVALKKNILGHSTNP
jgi:tetratricopeptide (TPR) repeat protein